MYPHQATPHSLVIEPQDVWTPQHSDQYAHGKAYIHTPQRTQGAHRLVVGQGGKALHADLSRANSLRRAEQCIPRFLPEGLQRRSCLKHALGGNLPNLCGQRCPRERERIGCPLFHNPLCQRREQIRFQLESGITSGFGQHRVH